MFGVWSLALTFALAVLGNLWIYATGIGPVSIDALAQVFIRPYKQWAEGHGPLRRALIVLVATGGLLYATFQAWMVEHQAHALSEGRRLSAIHWLDVWHQRAVDAAAEINNSTTGYKFRTQELQNELKESRISKAPAQKILPVPTSLLVGRDPNALYQNDKIVATVGGITIDLNHSAVTFQFVNPTQTLNPAKEVEFQELVLQCQHLPSALRPGEVGFYVAPPAEGTQCQIIRHR